MENRRVERDTMGEMWLPAEALYGATTQRAVENFPISGDPLPRELVQAIGLVKQASARVNRAQGGLSAEAADAIEAAAQRWRRGSTTSTSRLTFSRPAPAHRPT